MLCWFGYLRYQCRSVVLDTAELSGNPHNSAGRWGSMVYHCMFYGNCQVKLVVVEFVNILLWFFLKASIVLGLGDLG